MLSLGPNPSIHGVLELALGAIFIATLVVVSAIDVRRRLIPNVVLLVSGALALPLLATLEPAALLGRATAALLAMAPLALVAVVAPHGMGGGDVKLAGLLGLYLGAAVAAALVVAFVAGTLAGIAIAVRRGVGIARRATIPFGPFLALGGLVAWVAGDAILDRCLGLGA